MPFTLGSAAESTCVPGGGKRRRSRRHSVLALRSSTACRAAAAAGSRAETAAASARRVLYPPADVVTAGELEDSWRGHHWFTWPDNQFQPEEQEKTFTRQIRDVAQRLGVQVDFEPAALYQEAKVGAFIERAKSEPLDAVLIVNFWNTFSPWAARLAAEFAPTAIVHHRVGSNHQLPPESLRKAEAIYYIHSIENWDEIGRGLLAVRCKKMLAQSRLLRVSGQQQDTTQTLEPALNVDLVIECLFLFLEHRKPCVSFAINNGQLVPCGCENHLDGTLTLMLGRWLLERAGFLHNPEFDTSENCYLGAHCTCAWQLHDLQGAAQEYFVRPFFHQLPPTPALDVQWTPDEPVMLAKYLSGQNTLACWTGKVLYSPTSPPVGGCATRVLVSFDDIKDVCDVYQGPHPVLFCGDHAAVRRFRAFARMYRLTLQGNV